MVKSIDRNYGIDALRMICMLMIVITHVLGQGGILGVTPRFSAQYEIAYLLETFSYCAVNCYGIISGYVGFEATYKYTNLVVLWLRVVFYTILITGIFQIVKPEVVSIKSWINAIFPVMSQQYWYFTAYVVLFFFIPLLNIGLKRLSRNQLRIMLASLLVLGSLLTTLIRTDVFDFQNGYTVWWLIILYLIGGYMKKYKSSCSKPLLYTGVYVCGVGITWIVKFVIEIVTVEILEEPKGGDILLNYLSPTVLISAIALVVLFSKIRFSALLIKIITILSPLSFSVYVIHANPLIWENLIKDRFLNWGLFPPMILIILVLAIAILIYLGCSILDIIRNKLFNVLKIRKNIDLIEKKYITVLLHQ